MGLRSIRRNWRKRRQQRLDRPLPAASPQELAEIARLRAGFEAFAPQATAGHAASEAEWRLNLDELRRDVLDKDPRDFTRFPVVLKTMFVDDADYLPAELRHLKRRADWSTRWQPALCESGAGHPLPYGGHPETSGNLLHHCYHVARFTEATGQDPARCGFVLEFGGGYGSLCRVFHRIGFQGRYVIFDFPHFAALQRYFLRSAGMTVHEDARSFRDATAGVYCASTLEELDDLMPADARNALFVATWSLSESPAPLRAAIAARVRRMRAFLIGFQDRFNEMDNQAWFTREWMAALPAIDWQKLPIRHLPGNAYLFGVARA